MLAYTYVLSTYVMLFQVALLYLVQRISVPSQTPCCSLHLTIKDLKLTHVVGGILR